MNTKYEAILEAVNTQISTNNPPETKQTYERLLSEGFTEKKAKDLIGVVVSYEIYHCLKSKKPFNNDRFAAWLNKLPELPE